MKFKHKILILISILSAVIFKISLNYGMFWDNVLFASTMGNYLYEHGLFNWLFPNEFDPGHPPFLAFIQALGWRVFGYKLWVSHFVMIPFVIGLLYQIFILISRYIEKKTAVIAAFLLIIADPTLFTQLFLVNPEVIQLFFFLLAVNGILNKNIWLKTLGLFFLSIVTFRGMMLCASVFLFEVLQSIIIEKQALKKLINKKIFVSYLIGSIPAVSFVAWRLLTKGWLQTHPDSPWADCWHFVNLNEFIRNIIVLAHRFFDFGRIAIFLFLVVIFIFKRKLYVSKNVLEILLLAVSSIFFIAIISLASTNPFGHRYFIAAYIFFILLAFIVLSELKKGKVIIYLVLLVMLITGNLWIYPKKVAQGWDASMAHIPYYALRDEAIEYLDENQIDINSVGTFFPNSTTLNSINLNGDKREFPDFDRNLEYVFYSNVYNLTDEQYNILETEYYTIREFTKCRIQIDIMKRK